MIIKIVLKRFLKKTHQRKALFFFFLQKNKKRVEHTFLPKSPQSKIPPPPQKKRPERNQKYMYIYGLHAFLKKSIYVTEGRGERREGVKVKKILYKGVCVEVNAARQCQGRVKRPSVKTLTFRIFFFHIDSYSR